MVGLGVAEIGEKAAQTRPTYGNCDDLANCPHGVRYAESAYDLTREAVELLLENKAGENHESRDEAQDGTDENPHCVARTSGVVQRL